MSASGFDENERFLKGLAVRREVLGSAHVDTSLQKAAESPFMALMQQFTTEVGWGDVWARPGLERKTRSFLSIAVLAALGRTDELRTHVRGAFNNGATAEEIAEVLVHMTVYAGFPAGLEGFRVANTVVEEEAKKG